MGWSKALQRPHGLPRGVELARRVKLAQQGDTLAAFEVHLSLARALRRGTLDDRERDLLASMHEAIARGEDPAKAMLLAKAPNRPIKTRMQEFIADWIAREIDDHDAGCCYNGCDELNDAAADRRAAALFGIAEGTAKKIRLASHKT